MVDRDKVESIVVYQGLRSELGDFEVFVGCLLAYLHGLIWPE